jgi:hypothetical protein
MKIIKILSVIAMAMVMYSCKKTDPEQPYDARPAIPVSISNAIAFRPDPVVTTSLGGDKKIAITLSVEGTGRTIKEITRVATSTDYTAIQSTGNTGFYVLTPIPVDATSYTYNTSITEYFTINPVTGSNKAAAANAELSYRFYFLLKMDDGSTAISTPVRVLVLQ